MTRLLTIVGLLVSITTFAAADDVVFHRTQLVDGKNHETHADLIFSPSTRTLSVRVADRMLAEVPYDRIDKISYEYSKHHRVKQGAIIMVASLGAGSIVMLTKSKSHWLYVDYKDNDISKSIVLRMDKKEYKNILLTAREQTGKEVAVSESKKG
jgi:hypothetical protein